MSTYLTGLSKAPVFAVIIALVGCFRGFETAGSADSVGKQTTISVVQSIFLVIVTDALFSVVFNLARPLMPCQSPGSAELVVEIDGLNTRFGDAVVHENVSLVVRRARSSRSSAAAAAGNPRCCAR